jgi:hypothetical protein
MNGYLVLIDEQRVRQMLGSAAQRVDASRQLTPDELAVLQLTLGEVRLEPAEHG